MQDSKELSRLQYLEKIFSPAEGEWLRMCFPEQNVAEQEAEQGDDRKCSQRTSDQLKQK